MMDHFKRIFNHFLRSKRHNRPQTDHPPQQDPVHHHDQNQLSSSDELYVAAELYSADEKQQLLLNQKIINNLLEQGDRLVSPRRVDHWFYFMDSLQRDHFASWAIQNGFERETINDDEQEYQEGRGVPFPIECALQLFHITVPHPEQINYITLTLYRKAKEYGGEYDGWETFIIRN
jgi:regulator of RNase E activity RraB